MTTPSNDGYEHECAEENALQFLDWIRNRGGIALWRSINLANPGASWSTPALGKDGLPTPKPNWQVDNQPERVIRDPAKVLVYIPVEVQRFRVAIRPSSNGLMLKCTDASSRRVRRAVAKVGRGAFYRFDYATQEAVIYRTDKAMSLEDWAKAEGK